MKIKQQVTIITLGLYHLCQIGQVYSHDRQVGTRVETLYYMRTNLGMACLSNGAFIPERAFGLSFGACKDWGFKHCPNAAFTI